MLTARLGAASASGATAELIVWALCFQILLRLFLVKLGADLQDGLVVHRRRRCGALVLAFTCSNAVAPLHWPEFSAAAASTCARRRVHRRLGLIRRRDRARARLRRRRVCDGIAVVLVPGCRLMDKILLELCRGLRTSSPTRSRCRRRACRS